jgi:hypothetical protein
VLGIANFTIFDGSGGNSTGLTQITGNVGQWNTSTLFSILAPGTLTGGQNLGISATATALIQLMSLRLQLIALIPSASAVVIAAELGNAILGPGVYLSVTGAFQISPNLNLTLSGAGTYIFLVSTPLSTGTGTLTIGSNTSVVLTHQASSCGVIWKVHSAVFGANANFVGNVVSTQGISAMGGGSSFAGSLWAGADGNILSNSVNLNASIVASCVGANAVIPNPTVSSAFKVTSGFLFVTALVLFTLLI